MLMDAASVSHRSPDTVASDEYAAIFEACLNSAKLLSAARTCVGVHMCIFI